MRAEEIARICDEEGFDCTIEATMARADGGTQRVSFTIPLVASETSVRDELRAASISAHSFKPEDIDRSEMTT